MRFKSVTTVKQQNVFHTSNKSKGLNKKPKMTPASRYTYVKSEGLLDIKDLLELDKKYTKALCN